jgi:hypothetical protein
MRPRLHPGMLVVLESTTYPGTTARCCCRCCRVRAARWAATSSSFSPERVDPGNERFQTKNTPKVVGGTTPACLTHDSRPLQRGRWSACPGQLDRCRRDGQAAREHLPRRQHRPRQRDRDHVRKARARRLGGHRRRRDQAVRLHAVLSRPRPRRTLHSDRSRSICRGSCARSSTRPASSSSPTRSTPACPRYVVSRLQDALNDRAARPVQWLARARPRRGVQARH